jgi:hypothetical protein
LLTVCRPDRDGDGDDDSDVCVSAALGRPITFWDAKWLVVVSALGGLSAAVRCRPARLNYDVHSTVHAHGLPPLTQAVWHTRDTGAASLRALRALQRSRTARRVGVFRAAVVCALPAVAPCKRSIDRQADCGTGEHRRSAYVLAHGCSVPLWQLRRLSVDAIRAVDFSDVRA